jgi:PEP-CTERM motif
LLDPVISQVIYLDGRSLGVDTLYTEGTLVGRSDYGATGNSSVTLGSAPTLSAQLNTGNRGYVSSATTSLFYQVMWLNPNAGTELIDVQVDTLGAVKAAGQVTPGTFSSFDAGALASFSLGGWDVDKRLALCTSASSSSAGSSFCDGTTSTGIAPFSVKLHQNTVYGVSMALSLRASKFDEAQANASAMVDPIFSIVGPAPAGGQFVFSPGVTSAVPEPSTTALALVGMLLLEALCVRRRRRQGDRTSA